MDAFAYFSRFQPIRPEPVQTAWFYQHSFNFINLRSQWMLWLTFRRFGLAAQNPSKMHDLITIPSTLFDFEANGCFWLLLEISAQPSRTPPECVISAAFFNFTCFWNQWMLLLSFRRFGLATQNPSWMHNFISIPSILFDFETNGRFCLLFVVSSWPPRTPPEWIILPEFLQFYTILKPMDACAYCSRFQPGRPEPLEHMILLTFLQFWTILKPMSAFGYFSQFQLGRPEPLRNASFYQHSFNFTWFWSQWILFLLFVVSAWPPRTPLEHMILLAFLQFCVILKPMGGFAYFPRFQPSCPEPHPEGIILLAFLQFYTISKPTDAFRSFSPAAQNPPRTDDFISIPSFLWDFEVNRWRCLLFAVSV